MRLDILGEAFPTEMVGGGEEDLEQAGVLQREAEVPITREVEAIEGGAPLECGVEVPREALVSFAHDLHEDLLLAVEVPVQRRSGHPQLARELPHREALEPVREVELARARQNPIPLLRHGEHCKHARLSGQAYPAGNRATTGRSRNE